MYQMNEWKNEWPSNHTDMCKCTGKDISQLIHNHKKMNFKIKLWDDFFRKPLFLHLNKQQLYEMNK